MTNLKKKARGWTAYRLYEKEGGLKPRRRAPGAITRFFNLF